ncbi:MAG: hypothetical protein A3F72_15135 [Bacteroidetes bacterium RIFCSPLOWO2_12_FULL_35_15]|nr:MAG: hypothetical protein A3F72_15135 [Bacteroidetes bacterium RIFCSPLOWO2_12_FULL_35_15]
MKTNMGSIDRITRVLIAVMIIALYFSNIISGTIAIVLLVFSGVLIVTSFINFCPLYALSGIKTCKK